MDRFKKTQEIVNLIAILNYYQSIKPDFKLYWSEEEIAEFNKKYISVIKNIEEEISTEVQFFLDGDKNQF